MSAFRWGRWGMALGLLLAGTAQAQTVVKYVHTDALGSVVAVTDAARTVIERREYEPYGQQLPGVQAGPGYTGHVQDAGTGLVYMQQRYYDPGIGRFLSVDPVTAYEKPGQNFNRYWYANNNPYKFTDPDGRMIRDGWRNDWRHDRPFDNPCGRAVCFGGPGDHKAAQAAKKRKGASPDAPARAQDGITSPQDIYRRASEEASRSGLPGAHNGPQDALRHCIGTCEMTRQYGSMATHVLGEANEKRGDWTHNQSAEEKAMDRHNNSLGDSIGRNASSFRGCVVPCRAAVDNGMTVNGITSETPYVQYEDEEL